jgi:NTE family protein
MQPDEAAADAKRLPELGLALSGGGFRAAFFHLGVLARMAEVGLLRKVEVISTVSGGSIIGALYYLHVKDLLETRPAAEVRDEDYLRIVEHLQRTFLAGVQTHVRARAYADLRLNFAMAKADYSRSDRIGDLYGETFYAPAWDAPLFADAPSPLGPVPYGCQMPFSLRYR